MAYVFPLIKEPKADVVTKERTIIYLRNIDIPNANELGHCRYIASHYPLSPHLHEDSFEICYHVSGSQQYRVNNVNYTTNGGDLFITFPNEVHSSGKDNYVEEKSNFFFFSFNCMPNTKKLFGFEPDVSKYIINALHCFKHRLFKGNVKIRSLLQEIMELYFSSLVIKRTFIQCKLMELFIEIINLQQEIDKKLHEIPDDIDTVVNYINEHSYDKLNVEYLASMIYLSQSHFNQKFKHHVGVAPHEYLLRSKVELSKEMLRYTTKSITEIACDLSFSSGQYYATVFKRYEGISPTKYRESIWNLK